MKPLQYMVSSFTQCVSQKPKTHPCFICHTLISIYPQALYFLPPTCNPNSLTALHSLQVSPKPKPSSFPAYNHVTKWTSRLLPFQPHFKVLSRVPEQLWLHWFPFYFSNKPSSLPSQDSALLSSAWNTNSHSDSSHVWFHLILPDPAPLDFYLL